MPASYRARGVPFLLPSTFLLRQYHVHFRHLHYIQLAHGRCDGHRTSKNRRLAQPTKSALSASFAIDHSFLNMYINDPCENSAARVRPKLALCDHYRRSRRGTPKGPSLLSRHMFVLSKALTIATNSGPPQLASPSITTNTAPSNHGPLKHPDTLTTKGYPSSDKAPFPQHRPPPGPPPCQRTRRRRPQPNGHR